MISSEVERTLVKSPPELWTELSDPVALARHLGELGDIRITRIEPERAVEWEAGDTAGTVTIKPSGWGTKVTLTVTRELAAPEPPATPPEPPHPTPEVPDAASPPSAAEGLDLEHVATAEAIAHEAEPVPLATSQPIEPPADVVSPTRTSRLVSAASVGAEEEAEPEEPPAAPKLTARRGFFARLFRARRWRESATEAEEPGEPDPIAEPATDPQVASPQARPAAHDAFAAVAKALSPQALPSIDPFAAAAVTGATGPALDGPTISRNPRMVEPSPEPAAVISAELKAAEEAAAEEVTAVLTSVLDRLGAAHHRPFSRA